MHHRQLCTPSSVPQGKANAPKPLHRTSWALCGTHTLRFAASCALSGVFKLPSRWSRPRAPRALRSLRNGGAAEAAPLRAQAPITVSPATPARPATGPRRSQWRVSLSKAAGTGGQWPCAVETRGGRAPGTPVHGALWSMGGLGCLHGAAAARPGQAPGSPH